MIKGKLVVIKDWGVETGQNITGKGGEGREKWRVVGKKEYKSEEMGSEKRKEWGI